MTLINAQGEEFNMRGPIAGIIAVFMLQLGVIGYGSATRYFDESAEVAAVRLPAADLPSVSDSDVEISEPVLPQQFEFAEIGNPVTPKPANGNVRAAEHGNRSIGLRTFDTDFRPVTIRVPEPSPYTFSVIEPEPQKPAEAKPVASERPDILKPASARVVVKKHRRSFMSKTFAVIKKPYDWIKAIGSKSKSSEVEPTP